MSWFRVVILAAGEVHGYSDPLDLVTACVMEREMRVRGLPTVLMPNTRQLNREATEFFQRQQGSLSMVTVCSCGSLCVIPCKPTCVSPETPAEAPAAEPPKSEGCDGK